MTSRERSLLAAGVICGLLVASAVYAASRFATRPNSPAIASGAETVRPMAPPASDPARTGAAADIGSPGMDLSQAPPAVQLNDDEQQSIGIQVAVVHPRLVTGGTLLTGRVEAPETGLVNISARIAGRIDKLHLDFTGQPVQKGQPIANIYSPEILASAEEYKLALENKQRLGERAETQALMGADDLVAASRRRLELWGLTTHQIDTIAASDRPQIDLTIYSPTTGIVTERRVTQGQYVNAGEVLYSIADLSHVWVKADLYEVDLPQVHTGQGVEITSESLPGTKLRGIVEFLDPLINGQTRTTAARIQVPNPGLRLRPGAFVQARILSTSGTRMLAVPRSAVVNSGTRNVVYVASGNGLFEAHDVQLGPAGDDYYPVLAGLREGDKVVTQGNFLLDSQTRLSGGLGNPVGGPKELSSPTDPVAKPAQLSVRIDPESPKGGTEVTLHVTVRDARGAVTDAHVAGTLLMPAMPAMGMAEMRETAVLTWNGKEYVGKVKVQSEGSWSLTVEARHEGRRLGTYRGSVSAR